MTIAPGVAATPLPPLSRSSPLVSARSACLVGAESGRLRQPDHRLKPDRGWKRAFEDPIPLPRGRKVVTLKEAADYIMKLSKTEQSHKEWQDAIEALIMAAEDRGPLMHARIGMLRALNRHVERVLNPDRKDPHWGRRRS
jgi:hypothetical protein